MIPISDRNPTQRFAVVTLILIAVNVGVFLFVQRPANNTPGGDVRFTFEFAAIPCEVFTREPLNVREVSATLQGDDTACERGGRRLPDAGPNGDQEVFPHKQVWLSLLFSMFLHGGWLHLGGNMLFLWVFGNNVEDRLGPIKYLGFYLLGGFVASAAHMLVQPDSTVPVVGASGAIAAVMGAYLVWFPRAKIRTLIFVLLIFFVQIEARWLLLFWFVSQFFTGAGSGVAWVAHVGGFVFGAIVAWLFRARRPPSHVPPGQWQRPGGPGYWEAA